MEYLGFWVTNDGVKPINKKERGNKNMKPPTHQKQSRQFIGVANYYYNRWERRSHTLVHLTKIASNKVKFKWTKIEQ